MNNPDSDLEKRLWSSADKLRSNIDAAEYKHVVLGLIFLKYVSDSFEEIHNNLENDRETFPIRKTGMNIFQGMFSGYLLRQGGITFRRMQSSQQ